jgi:hypothetical protein
VAVTLVFARSRLGQLLTEPGGITCARAFAAAKANLATISGDLEAEVDRNLALLRDGVAPSVPSVDAAARRQAYAQANIIAGLAAYCGLGPLGRVAFSLCELIDRLIEAGRWNQEAVEVHLNAMGVMRELSDLESPACAEIIDALTDLVRQASA